MPFIGPSESARDPGQPPLVWRHCPAPVALVLLPWREGCTIAERDADGTLYGCRDVSFGELYSSIVSTWIDGARAEGLAIEDRRDQERDKLNAARLRADAAWEHLRLTYHKGPPIEDPEATAAFWEQYIGDSSWSRLLREFGRLGGKIQYWCGVPRSASAIPLTFSLHRPNGLELPCQYRLKDIRAAIETLKREQAA